MIDGWLEDLKPGYSKEEEYKMQEYATAEYHRLCLALRKIDDRFYFMRSSCYLKFRREDDKYSLFNPSIISWSSKWAHIATKVEYDSKTGKIFDFTAENDIWNLTWATTKEISEDWKDKIKNSCRIVYNVCCEAIRQEKEEIKKAKQREIREAAAQYE